MVEDRFEDHARVEVLSGPHKGIFGWVPRDLITPRWHKAAIHDILTVLMILFVGVLLLVAAKVVWWVVNDPRAIYAKPAEGPHPLAD